VRRALGVEIVRVRDVEGRARIEGGPRTGGRSAARVEESRRPCSRLVFCGGRSCPGRLPRRRRRRPGPLSLWPRKSSTTSRRSATFVALRPWTFPARSTRMGRFHALGPADVRLGSSPPSMPAWAGSRTWRARSGKCVGRACARSTLGRTPPGRRGPEPQALESRSIPNVAFEMTPRARAPPSALQSGQRVRLQLDFARGGRIRRGSPQAPRPWA